MEIADLVQKINGLNEEGIKLTMQSPPRYDEALAKHWEALQLSRDQDLNPDYTAFSTANIGYALRRTANSPAEVEEVLHLLGSAYHKTMTDMPRWAVADSSRQETYAGTARLLEEMALVHKYTPNATEDDLSGAYSSLNIAIGLYEAAVENAPAEIIPADQINSRLWRTLGVASTVATDLANHFPRERKSYLKQAVDYAQQELDFRLAAGEKNGFPLLNAYHTLGVAQTELANRNKKMYLSAKENLHITKSLAEEAGKGMVVSVLNFREAWLEYKRSPLNKKVICKLVQTVLEQQEQESMRWDNGVKNTLRSQVSKLGTHLGGTYQQRIEQMYSV